MERCGHQVDLWITAGVAGIHQLAGGTQAQRLAHRANAVETGEWDGQREIHVGTGKDCAEIGGLAVIGVTVQEGEAKPTIRGLDEERPQTEG